MTKQTQTTATPEEKPTADLLLRRFKLMDEIVEDVRKKNIEAGLDPKLMGYYIMYDSEDSAEKKRYLMWLAKVTNKRTGKFHQIKDLKARELIPEDEESEHEGKTYPYRTLSALSKVKTGDGKLWLMRHERWYGLDAAGQEVTLPVLDLDYYQKPVVTYERIPKDPGDPNGPSIRVGKIMTHLVFTAEQPGNKTYLTPYSKEKVEEFLKYAGPLDNHGNGTSLSMIKEGSGANPVGATYDQFIAEDFDTTFDRIRAPEPDFKDFYKNYKKAKEAAKDDEQPYG
jgi:hypothetical protein